MAKCLRLTTLYTQLRYVAEDLKLFLASHILCSERDSVVSEF